MKRVVSSIYMETHCHATEDIEKVEAAIMNMIPPSLRNEVKISRDVLRGYYGNPIIVLRVEILNSDHALMTAKFLSNLMTSHDRKRIRDTLALRLNELKNLYIRVDKQQAYRGVARVAEHDDVIKVKVSISLRTKNISEVKDVLKSIGLIE